MTRDEPTPVEDAEFADLLAACDEALAGSTMNLPDGDLPPPSVRPRIEKNIACLLRLQKLRPGKADAPTLPAPAAISPMPRRVGRFEVRRELGRGGFGVVYLARDPELHRDVALKVPHPHAVASAEMRARFDAEARATARLDHPNIAAVHEVGGTDSTTFIVTAYCPGGTLADYLYAHAPLPAANAARLIQQLASAVQHAHERGVVHRDLKPTNVLLGGEGVGLRGGDSNFTTPPPHHPTTPPPHHLATPPPHHLATPKIIDFGLAKCRDLGPDTATGAVLGTPNYMAPEQTGGREVGPAADIYALGAILYECLTGRPPFQGATPLETLDLARKTDPVPPGRLRPGLPRDLETVCLKCLEKEPGRRYASASALADDLTRFLDGRPVTARRVGAIGRGLRWARRQPAVAALAAALVLAVAGGTSAVLVEWRRAEALAEANGKARDVASELALANAAARDRAEADFRAARELVDRLALAGGAMLDKPGLDDVQAEAVAKVYAFYQSVLAAGRDDPGLRRDAARAAQYAGRAWYNQRKPDQALEAYRVAVRLYDGLLANSPDDRVLISYQADSLYGEGRVLKATARPAEAVACYRRSVELRERLYAPDPTAPNYAAGLSIQLVNLGGMFRAGNAEARAILERAIEVLQPALLAHPDHVNLHQSMGLALEERKRHLVAGNDLVGAEAAIRQAVTHFQAVAKRSHKVGHRLLYHRSRVELGDLLSQTGRHAEAEAEYRLALAGLEAVLVEFPNMVNWRASTTAYWAKLRGTLQKAGRRADEEETFAHQLRHCAKLAESGEAADARRLARAYGAYARWLARAGRDADAVAAYRRALRAEPTAAELNEFAWLLTTSRAASLRDPAEAVDLAERAVAMVPTAQSYANTLGAARYRAGDAAGAVAAIDEALALKDGANGWNWYFRALARQAAGDAAGACEDLAAANEWADRQTGEHFGLKRLRAEAEAAVLGTPP